MDSRFLSYMVIRFRLRSIFGVDGARQPRFELLVKGLAHVNTSMLNLCIRVRYKMCISFKRIKLSYLDPEKYGMIKRYTMNVIQYKCFLLKVECFVLKVN